MEENQNNSTEEIKEAIQANNENVTEEKVASESKTIDTDELKKETANTVNQVKETVKNVDIKKESEATKNFVVDFVKNPIGKIKEIAQDTENKYFVTTLILVILWVIIVAISTASNYTHFFKYNFWSHTLSVFKAMLSPILGILAMSLIIFIMNKENKKNLMTCINTVTATKIPVFLAAIVNLLKIFNLRDMMIITTFVSFCSVISIVLSYFGIKGLFGAKDDEKFFKKFLLIEGIYYIVYFVISYLGIYI